MKYILAIYLMMFSSMLFADTKISIIQPSFVAPEGTNIDSYNYEHNCVNGENSFVISASVKEPVVIRQIAANIGDTVTCTIALLHWPSGQRSEPIDPISTVVRKLPPTPTGFSITAVYSVPK